MNRITYSIRLFTAVLAVVFALTSSGALVALAQARRVPPPTGNQKKNKRPDGTEQPGEKTEEPLPTDLEGKSKDAETIKVSADLVNVDTVVYNKKSGQIVTGLKQGNFTILVDGVKRDITNFSTPEAPITVSLVVEFSKLSERFGYYGSGGYDYRGTAEVILPTATFLTQFVRPPQDYVSVIAYDIRPTPLTDFTNSPQRINQVINLLIRNNPAFRETNLFDALKFTLIGGRGDSVVLENSKEEKADYGGLVSVQANRKAVLLVCSGIDTFSKINYDEARKIAQNAGIPIYIIGTAEMFMLKYGDSMGATDSLLGDPGRMSMLQARNALSTFAKETGGAYYPIKFPQEVGNALQSINTLLRNQYSLAFNLGDLRDGKQHKIEVKVDVDGDGQSDEKQFEVKSRKFYSAPKA